MGLSKRPSPGSARSIRKTFRKQGLPMGLVVIMYASKRGRNPPKAERITIHAMNAGSSQLRLWRCVTWSLHRRGSHSWADSVAGCSDHLRAVRAVCAVSVISSVKFLGKVVDQGELLQDYISVPSFRVCRVSCCVLIYKFITLSTTVIMKWL